jgi:hypothetical protein
MAIINSYPTATPTGSDLIIGTDVSTTPNSTKTFTIDSINALSTSTPAAGTLNTVPLFTSAIAIGDSTIVRSGAGATSIYTFGGGTAISNTAITTTDLTTTGNTILGNTSADTLTVNAASTFTDNLTITTGNFFTCFAGATFQAPLTVNSTSAFAQPAVFAVPVTIPVTPVASTDAASKSYVDSVVGYTTYVSRISQTGANAPVDTVIFNNTGLTFTWSRTGTGTYRVTPSSSFVVNKTWIQMTGGDVTGSATTIVTIKDISTAFATAVNVNLISGAVADEITAAFVEIRIYP